MIFHSRNIFVCLASIIVFAPGILAVEKPEDSQFANAILLARNDMNIQKLQELVCHLTGRTEMKNDQRFYYLAFLQLNIAIYYFNNNQPRQSFANLNKAHLFINKSLECAKTTEALVLKAQLVDFQIMFNSSRTEELSQTFWQCLEQAGEIDPENPRLYLVQGLHLYFTPSFAGGDIQLAKQNLLKAVHLFSDENPPPAFLHWGYEDALAWLGQIAVQQDSLELAIHYYDQALSANENFNWIKYGLLPETKSALDVKNSVWGIVARFLVVLLIALLFLVVVLRFIKIKIIKI